MMFARPRLSDDSGNVLVVVVLVSMLVGGLAALTLRTGTQADFASSSDRNSEVALGVAEAGLHSAITDINQMAAAGTLPATDTFDGQLPEGLYDGEWTRCRPTTWKTAGFEECLATGTRNGFVVEASATKGGDTLGRTRRVRIALQPPEIFPDDKYALFSKTSIDLKNNDTVTGDVWANDNVIARQSLNLDGSITAAQGYIKVEKLVDIERFVWSGGFNAADDGWGVYVGEGSTIHGYAKASHSSPSDPDICASTASNYDIIGTGSVAGDVTTPGSATVAHDPSKFHQECTAAPAPKALPVFNFNWANYSPPDPADCTATSSGPHCVFASVSEFQLWLNTSDHKNALKGVFEVNEPAPSQSAGRRIDLSGAKVDGDLVIVTNAPIFTNGMEETGTLDEAIVVLVSHYNPPVDSGCDVNHDSSECAIHIKNNFSFSPECKTATLAYADLGPVAIKNNQAACGSVISEGILVKNNQTLTYDPRLDRILGFGPVTYEVARWEELPIQ